MFFNGDFYITNGCAVKSYYNVIFVEKLLFVSFISDKITS